MYASSPQSGALALRANLRANLARSRRKLAQRPDMMRWDSCRRGLGDGSDAIPGMIPLFGAQKFDPQFAAPETPKQNGLVAFSRRRLRAAISLTATWLRASAGWRYW